MLDSVRLETKCNLATEFKRVRETQKSAPVVPGFMGGTNYAYWLFGAVPNRLMRNWVCQTISPQHCDDEIR